jgi:NAD(P)H-flavin reductase
MKKGQGEKAFMPRPVLCMTAIGGNAYMPRQAVVNNIIEENSQVKTLELVMADEIDNANFTYQPGQFLMLSLPHCGEAPFTFSSSPTARGRFTLSIRRAGLLTGAAHELRPGDKVGVRGPYGRPFPLADFAGRDLLFVAGGIGMAPLRSVLAYCLANRRQYGAITVLYGCREPGEFCYRQELEQWQETADIRLLLTVDRRTPEWRGRVGLVTALLDEIEIDPQRLKAVVCGPGVMIRFVITRLRELGMGDQDIITTLERQMKCGIGLCGHCFIEEKLVCTDGPVFGAEELPGLEKL